MRKILCIIIAIILLTTMTYAHEIVKPTNTIAIDINQEGKDIVITALSYLGYKYRYGGNGPYYFDCSGLVQYIMKQSGYEVGRTASAQSQNGEIIKRKDLLPGDIVLFKNTYIIGYSHSGIYIGDNQFIHAANSREGVIISSLNEHYYNIRFSHGIRVWVQYKIFITPFFLK